MEDHKSYLLLVELTSGMLKLLMQRLLPEHGWNNKMPNFKSGNTSLHFHFGRNFSACTNNFLDADNFQYRDYILWRFSQGHGEQLYECVTMLDNCKSKHSKYGGDIAFCGSPHVHVTRNWNSRTKTHVVGLVGIILY